MSSSSLRLDAKENFKLLIIQHHGDATSNEVKKSLDELVRLAAEYREYGVDSADAWSPAHTMDLNEGRWESITTPPFSGKLPDDDGGKCKLTLGHLSFGIFKPTHMVCAVEDIVNIVRPVDEKEGLLSNGITSRRRSSLFKNNEISAGDPPTWMQTYHIEVIMEIETPSAKLPAKMTNCGFCFPETPMRLGVKFLEGKLEPQFDLSSSENGSLAAAWREIFENAVTKEAETQLYLGRLGTWAMYILTNKMMGLEPLKDNSIDFTQTYKIGRPYTGHLDIVYLDEDFRVTRGIRVLLSRWSVCLSRVILDFCSVGLISNVIKNKLL